MGVIFIQGNEVMIYKFFFIIFLVSVPLASQAVKVERVILGCDTNPMYVEFWPIVAKTWKEIVGVKPTLALIAPADFPIDETIGEVIRFEPIPGIPTAFQAQVIRLLLPIYFPNEFCIISDMDMIPLQSNFFLDNLAPVPSDSFVIFNDAGKYVQGYPEYLMCYVAALGKTYGEIFSISSVNEIFECIQKWHKLNQGWTSDQCILYNAINSWDQTRIIKLGYDEPRRVDRAYWRYHQELLRRRNYYVDSHLLRPYSAYKKEIDALLEILF